MRRPAGTTPNLMQRRHELQGPRPAALVVTKQDSHHTENKKKRRHQPVIIYVESPKVIHAHPSEFRSVVQRLTGAATSSSSGGGAALPPHQFPFQLYGGIANDLDFSRGALPFVASTVSPMAAAASLQVPPVSESLLFPSGGASCSRSLSSFFSTSDHQLISPAAFLFEDQTNLGRATSVVQANTTGILPCLGGAM